MSLRPTALNISPTWIDYTAHNLRSQITRGSIEHSCRIDAQRMRTLAHQMPLRSQSRKEEPLFLRITGSNVRFRSALGLAIKSLAVILSVFCAISVISAQRPLVPSAPADQSTSSAPRSEADSQKEQQEPSTPAPDPATQSGADPQARQTKRIFGVIPNYRAVSAATYLPQLTAGQKFVLATQDSFDYSAFILAGMLAGYGQATNSYREFHQGASGYGRYYWHSFADQAVGNYFTEAIIPSIFRQDPRYYTLGHGGFFRRTGYALSRLAITKTDSGGTRINISELLGNAMGAGLSDAYYPREERTWGKTGAKWGTQIGVDGVANVLKEFWPDIYRRISHPSRAKANGPTGP
jgi:hypothetical protein